MTHVASIDLADLRGCGAPMLGDGQLAFFLPMGEGRQGLEVAVRHVTDPGPTRRPDDLPEVSRMSGGSRAGPLPFHVDACTLGHHPIHLTRQEPQGNAPFDPPHAVSPSARGLAQLLPNGADPWLWDSAHWLAATLPRSTTQLDAAQARVEKSLATAQSRLHAAEQAHAKEPTDGTQSQIASAKKWITRLTLEQENLIHRRKEYAALVTRTQSWVQDKDPWSAMPDEAVEALSDIMKSLKHDEYGTESGPFGVHYRSGEGKHYRDNAELTSETLVAMSIAAPDVFRLLPDAVQRLIILKNDNAGKSAAVQMFGVGHAIQDANDFNCDKHMLAQFSGADAQGLAHGAIKVWILPADLEAGAFDKASVTYEYD